MSVQAVGIYIEKLRTRKHKSVSEVVAAMKELGVETTAAYIWRIEHGQIDSPGARLLNALVLTVGGSLEDATRLLLDKHATLADGIDKAEAWLRRSPQEVSDAAHSADELEILVNALGNEL